MPDTALCTSQRLKFIYQHSSSSSGWGGSSVGKASDWHIADAGSIPQSGKGFFSQSRLSVQTLLRCLYTPLCNCMHLHLCARYRSRSPCQRSVNYGNTKTPSMYCRLGSTTLVEAGFLKGKGPEFSVKEILTGQYRANIDRTTCTLFFVCFFVCVFLV